MACITEYNTCLALYVITVLLVAFGEYNMLISTEDNFKSFLYLQIVQVACVLV